MSVAGPPNTRRIVARFLAGEITMRELRRAFPNSVWSPEYDDLPHVGEIQLLCAEDDYPICWGGQNSDEANRTRLRDLLRHDDEEPAR